MGYYYSVLEVRKCKGSKQCKNLKQKYIYSIISNIHTWYFQQQKIKPSSMKAILSILHADIFLMNCLNKVIEQCHQCPVRNTVLNEEGPYALGRGRDIKAKNYRNGKISCCFLFYQVLHISLKKKRTDQPGS